MDLHEILQHKTFAAAETLPGRIEKKMRGSMNVSEDGCVLYVIKKILGESCKVFLNIGVGHGGSMIVAMAANCPCNHVGVDPFDRTENGVGVTRDQAEININENNPNDHGYGLIHGRSSDKAVIARVADECPEVDLLFIDGIRPKTQAKKDLAAYGKLVRPGGVVVVDGHGKKIKPRTSRQWNTVAVLGLGELLILERK